MRIERRFAGPPGSANGGVACGLLAAHVDAPVVEVTLRRPPPLDRDLQVRGGELYDGNLLVAAAVPGTVDLTPPPAVGLQQAAAAAASYAGREAHPFPGCFVCGTDLEPPDGLGLRPGAVADRTVAALWTPTSDEAFLVWAALDCPGAWANHIAGQPQVLGRMTLQHRGRPTVGKPHVVMGWMTGAEGRKMFCGTALYDDAGQVLAVAQQTWFAVDVEKVGRPQA